MKGMRRAKSKEQSSVGIRDPEEELRGAGAGVMWAMGDARWSDENWYQWKIIKLETSRNGTELFTTSQFLLVY